MIQEIKLNGCRISYFDAGAGSPLLFVHCSSASHKEWKQIGRRFQEQHRTLMPDLLGYGASEEWGTPAREASGLEDTEVLDAILERAGGPVHVIAHSYGGAVALQQALAEFQRPAPRIKSLFLIEPVSFHVLRTGGRMTDWAGIDRRAGKVVQLAKEGKINKAADIYMSYWLGWLKWRLSPARFRQEVRRTLPKVAYEFSNMYVYDQTPEDYAVIDCPVTLVCGGKTTPEARAIVQVLGQTLSQARVESLAGAGHMSPFTHPEPVCRLIRDHLDRVGAQ